MILDAAKHRLDLAIAAKVEELLEAQLQIAKMGAESPSAANAACDSLLDRAFGRPRLGDLALKVVQQLGCDRPGVGKGLPSLMRRPPRHPLPKH